MQSVIGGSQVIPQLGAAIVRVRTVARRVKESVKCMVGGWKIGVKGVERGDFWGQVEADVECCFLGDWGIGLLYPTARE